MEALLLAKLTLLNDDNDRTSLELNSCLICGFVPNVRRLGPKERGHLESYTRPPQTQQGLECIAICLNYIIYLRPQKHR